MSHKLQLPMKHIPLSLYIHLPWCIRKCPYCDFNSHVAPNTLPEAEYMTALLEDLEQEWPRADGRPLQSIFIGGGTPSLFSPHSIEQLLKKIAQRLKWAPQIEITLEANPGTAEQQKFRDFHHNGINRLSIGVQSFNEQHLKKLGRIHNGSDAKKAIDIAHHVGFKNFNIDLMYGLSQQKVDEALSDLETAISLQPAHLSWYQLTLEPNTLFYQQSPPLPNQDDIFAMEQEGRQLLKVNSYQHYEVSAYAKPNYQCIHNNNYWQFGDYLAIGAGAHGKITAANGDVIRYWKHKHPKQYLSSKNSFIAEEKIITEKELPFEFMLNALRLQKPIAIDLFNRRTGLALSDILLPLTQAKEQGLLQWDNHSIETTALGKKFLNDLLVIFMNH